MLVSENGGLAEGVVALGHIAYRLDGDNPYIRNLIVEGDDLLLRPNKTKPKKTYNETLLELVTYAVENRNTKMLYSLSDVLTNMADMEAGCISLIKSLEK